MIWVREPVRRPDLGVRVERNQDKDKKVAGRQPGWRFLFSRVKVLLAFAVISQFALSIFEGTFALHAKPYTRFGPSEMGWVFMACGLVMAGAQALVVGKLTDRFGVHKMLTTGFMIMGLGMAMLMTSQAIVPVLIYVSIFAFGVALISPSLATLVSIRNREQPGASLGYLSAAVYLGLALGPIIGGVMISFNRHLPYLVTVLLLLATGWYLLNNEAAIEGTQESKRTCVIRFFLE